MVTAQVFDHGKRKRSFDILMAAQQALNKAA